MVPYLVKENALTCLSFPQPQHACFNTDGLPRELDDTHTSIAAGGPAHPHEPPPFRTAHAGLVNGASRLTKVKSFYWRQHEIGRKQICLYPTV